MHAAHHSYFTFFIYRDATFALHHINSWTKITISFEDNFIISKINNSLVARSGRHIIAAIKRNCVSRCNMSPIWNKNRALSYNDKVLIHPRDIATLFSRDLPRANRIHWIMHRRALKYKWLSELLCATLGRFKPPPPSLFPLNPRNTARILLC